MRSGCRDGRHQEGTAFQPAETCLGRALEAKRCRQQTGSLLNLILATEGGVKSGTLAQNSLDPGEKQATTPCFHLQT
ncbi:hypothetical protein SKAU_G00159820 [Synaphobranchus kaupii]|uniref:Uncharacterized protein n=1 Tax=Synaphobranchus kaupii TaxID=118154 RepID=A0A9Q1FIR2_SYNKA|nr:hypothetical protein SKAU_G00159820 [Synaphobranchus kaupii]